MYPAVGGELPLLWLRSTKVVKLICCQQLSQVKNQTTKLFRVKLTLTIWWILNRNDLISKLIHNLLSLFWAISAVFTHLTVTTFVCSKNCSALTLINSRCECRDLMRLIKERLRTSLGWNSARAPEQPSLAKSRRKNKTEAVFGGVKTSF